MAFIAMATIYYFLPLIVPIAFFMRTCQGISDTWNTRTKGVHEDMVNSLAFVRYDCKLNSLAPGRFEWNFKYLILQIISVIDGLVISCELAIRRMSLDLTDEKSTLVQIMAWCRQATTITWANVDPDLCLHMASLGPSEIIILVIFKLMSSIHWVSHIKLLSGEFHGISLVISQHCFRYWLGTTKQQTINWANVDLALCSRLASLEAYLL